MPHFTQEQEQIIKKAKSRIGDAGPEIDLSKFNKEQRDAIAIAKVRTEQKRVIGAKKKEIELKSFSDRMAVAVQFGSVIGTATGKMLMGQKDAWREASIAIIDMIVAQAQASIFICHSDRDSPPRGPGNWPS